MVHMISQDKYSMIIDKPTQIVPLNEPNPNSRTFENKGTQAESVQYYDVENVRETSGQCSPISKVSNQSIKYEHVSEGVR